MCRSAELHEQTNCPRRYFTLNVLYDTVPTAQDVEIRIVSDDYKKCFKSRIW